jgi:hypothetical protein
LFDLPFVRRICDFPERYGKSFKIKVFADAPHGVLKARMPERYRKLQTCLALSI